MKYLYLVSSFFWEEHFRKSWECARSWCLVQPIWLETQFHIGRCARFLCPPNMEQRMETSSARLVKDGKKTWEKTWTKHWICSYSVYILFALLMMVKSQYNSLSHNGRTYEQLSAQMLGIENLMTQMVGQVVGRVNLQGTSLSHRISWKYLESRPKHLQAFWVHGVPKCQTRLGRF